MNQVDQIAEKPVEKTNLLGLSLPQLQGYLQEMGEKPFRAAQIMKWIHQRGVTDFDAMTDISRLLREKLHDCAEVRPPNVVEEHLSSDGCYKWIVEVASGSRVETVYIPEAGRGTLCISSQAGCMLDCSFCATGKQGFNSNLTTAEVIGQLWWANRRLDGFALPVAGAGKTQRPVSNIVMMGMGEPLLNYDAVLNSMRIMLDDFAYGMSKRRVTLSTSGVVPKIDQLAEDIDVALAISLHATNDELRNELVPINKKYPLEQLIAACQRYIKKDGNESARKHVTIEYVMLDGVNDSIEHAKEMIKLLKDLPSKINLIPFNPFPHAPYGRSSRNRIISFQKTLSDAGFVCTIRQTRGDDIDAACGQLVGQVADRTRRAEQWKKKVAERNEIMRSQG